MRSVKFILGLSLMVLMTLAQTTDTINESTTVTVFSCSSEVTVCPATTSVAVTTPTLAPTYSVPSYSISSPSVSVSTTITPTILPGAILSTSTPPAYASSNTSTAPTSVELPATSPSNVSTRTTGNPTFSNSTMTAPSIIASTGASEAPILAASGTPTPSFTTSITVVTPSVGVAPSSATSSTPGKGAAGRCGVPGFTMGLGLLGVLAYLVS